MPAPFILHEPELDLVAGDGVVPNPNDVDPGNRESRLHAPDAGIQFRAGWHLAASERLLEQGVEQGSR